MSAHKLNHSHHQAKEYRQCADDEVQNLSSENDGENDSNTKKDDHIHDCASFRIKNANTDLFLI
jgi:hypothetical protein